MMMLIACVGQIEAATYLPDSLDSAARDVDCQVVPTPLAKDCRTITVQGKVYRYGLVGDKSSNQAVLLDFGGPGVASLGFNGAVDVLPYLPDGLQNYAVLILEEPWVTSRLSELCWQAGRQYVSYTLGRSNEPPKLADDCEFGSKYGWTPHKYRSVVSAILSEQKLELQGFVGISFASVRLSYLALVDQPDWAILNSPLPPRLTTNALVEHQIKKINIDSIPKGVINTFETNALAMGIVDNEQSEFPEGVSAANMKMAAAAAIGSFGNNELSLSRLAFFEEFCPIGGQFESRGSENHTDSFYSRLYSPCKTSGSSFSLNLPKKSCVAFSKQDSFIPSKAMSMFEADTIQSLEAGEHGQFELFEACQDFVDSLHRTTHGAKP